MASFPARLHVLLAPVADVGLVIRRGPSKQVAFVGWDRRRDEFELGQWMKHRVYERRCDLSPDGRHVIYFAMNGHWSSESRGAWSAISRAPYAKALVMLPKGDCWHGGGLWTSNSTYWLNDGYGHDTLHDSRAVRRDRGFRPTGHYGGECPGVYYNRLQRDGWTLVASENLAKHETRDIFERPLVGGFSLRKIAHCGIDHPEGTGCYWDEHEVLGRDGSVLASHPDWEWADLDSRRLVWATGGKLFAAPIRRGRIEDPTELHDFNAMEFEAIEAPY